MSLRESRSMVKRPLQLIRLERGNDSKHKLVVDESVLSSILNQVGNTKIALISATGSSRSGKSYFLNHVLRYYTWEQDENEDWMGWDNPKTQLEGFEWRGGKDAVTTGIWIWPEPLMIKSSSREAIALLLIDTQGTLNEFTTEEESIVITSLCFLISSITIYNVKNDVEHETLQLIKKSLQLCLETKEDYSVQDLLFTVRDWRKDNGFDYGMKSGWQYLKEKLQVKPGLTEDARFCRELITENFKDIKCILFPDPGEKVKAISHNGCLAEVHALFTQTLEEIPSWFDADILCRKYTGENSMGFKKLFKASIKLLNDHNKERSIQQSSISHCTHLQAFEMYKRIFEEHPGEFFSSDDVKVVHETALMKSKNYLEEENSQIPYKAMRELQSKFETIVQDYYSGVVMESERKGRELQKTIQNATNAVIETYIDDMKMVFSKDTVAEKQIDLKHKLMKEDGLASFEGLIPKKYRHIDLGYHITALEREIDENFFELKTKWETRKRERMDAQWKLGRLTAIEDYRKRMKEMLSGQSFLEQNSLQEFHDRIQKFVLDKYCSIFDYGDFTEEFQAQLRNDLRKIFMDFDKSNTAKMIEAIEGKLGKALAIAVSNYRQELESIEQDFELSEDGFRQKNDQEQENIRFQFLAAIQQEPDHIQNEFLGKLNLEFEQHSKIALEKFQSATVKYANIIEMKKNEIEADVDQVLKKHKNSSEIFIVGKTEELGKNLIEQSMIKLSSLKKDANVPSAMLAAAQSKTIEQIKNKIKAVKEKTDERMTEYKDEVNDFVNLGFVYYKSIMDNLDDIDSEELLEEKHSNSLKGCVQELKKKSLIKDENWLQPFIRQLEENIITYYNSDVKKVFMFEFSQHNMILNSAKMEATKMYREEMEDYFKKTPFTKPIDLQAYNSKLCAKISKQVTAKLKLKKEQSAKLIQFLARDFETYQNKNTMNTPTGDPAIGIDLGTTYTCVAIYDKGEAKVIPNEQGKFTFPSYVAFTPAGETIGHPAKEMAHAYPQKTIFDAKRLIGRRFDEDTVQRDIKNWPFEVVNDENAPKIKVQTKDGEKIFPPEQISAKILNHVKVIAERHLGKPIKKAVITVPAYFNDGQRQATKDAGEIAGLEVLQIINEPTAAAMAYHLSTKGVRQERNILVYDLGGGTFDVVVLNMKPGGHIVVKSVNGDTHLGGEDFDDNLLEEMIKRYKQKHGVDLSAGKNSVKVDEKDAAARILRRLRNACEAAKINVSGGNNTTGEVNVEALVGVKDFIEPITRQEFEDLNMDLFLKTLVVVGKALQDAHLEKEDIHDIVLVGGSTRIPKVQEMLSEYFDKTLQATVNPDEAVACGAAIQAAILNGNQEQILKNISLNDVTPLSLGVELYDDSFSTIIKRNSSLPATGTEDYQTAKDFQDQVAIVIYEGEEKLARDNHLLGKFILKGIPKARKGVEKIIVNMEVDKEGILKVTAVCKSTGAQNNITIEDNRGRLTKEEKRRLKAEFD